MWQLPAGWYLQLQQKLYWMLRDKGARGYSKACGAADKVLVLDFGMLGRYVCV